MSQEEIMNMDHENIISDVFEHQERKLKQERKRRGLATRKANKEREQLAEESISWAPKIKPYRRGQY